MTFANVVVYLALIGYVLLRKFEGQPVGTPRRLFALPIVLIVIGFGDLSHGRAMAPMAITLTVIGAALSLGLGLLRGRADKLSVRDGSPFVRWGAASLTLFAANIAAKLVLDLIGVAAGSAGSTVSRSLLLSFGLTLLGEAAVIWMRTGGVSALLNAPQTTRPRS
jgi:hypothetical protein